MGTNFYAHVIPTKKKREEIKEALDRGNFNEITQLVNRTYGEYSEWDGKSEMEPCGIIHLGKRSGGWKFLWNPNVYVIRHGHYNEDRDWIIDPNTGYYLYPLTKKGIKAFIDRKDVKIYDEYGDIQDKEKFFEEAINWTTWKGKEAWDSDSYHRETNDEIHYVSNSELVRLLMSEGYSLSKDRSDFYSDGLRFATSTDFS